MHRWTPKTVTAAVCAIAVAMVTPHVTAAQNLWNALKKAARAVQQAERHVPRSPSPQPGAAAPTAGQSRAAAFTAPPVPGSAPGTAGRLVPPPGTKIDVQTLSPMQQGAKFFVSPHGVHVATYETSGSRAVIYYDGTEGPPFDQILGGNGADNQPGVVFSPDGKRYAYCGRTADQFVVMVDGHELARSSESQQGKLDAASCRIGFTSNSRHVYYTTSAGDPTTSRHYVRFVFDGHSAPLSGSYTVDPIFSPDGDHYAMIVTDPANRNKWGLVIDGKLAPYLGGDPQWSADSRHLYTLRRIRLAGGRCCGVEALRDGKPFLRGDDIALHIPPAGDRVVALVTKSVSVRTAVQFLVIGGRKVPASQVVVNQGRIDHIVFSPDGRHYAARLTNPDNRQYVLVDGRRRREYQSVDNIGFTADSSTVVYTAFTNGKGFVVYGDRESNPCTTIAVGAAENTGAPIAFAPVGRGAASICGGTEQALFLDGKMVALAGRGASDLSFSSNGKHYAYVGPDRNRVWRLFLDNVAQPASHLGQSDTTGGDQYAFSPNGRHIAIFSWTSPSNPSYVRGVFVDGKFLPVAQIPYFYRLGFTADSRHLAWAQPVPGGNRYRVYIDGRPVLDADSAIAGNSPIRWWDMASDGSLSVLAQTDKSLVRIRITPSPNTSLATLLALAH